MFLFRRVAASVAVLSTLFVARCKAQQMAEGSYVEPTTGVKFSTWTAEPNSSGDGGVTLGIALPSDAAETDATEYIGYLSCASTSAEKTGWCGVAHGGTMVKGLLLVAWPHEDEVLTSFRMATDYFMPDVYTGNSTLTQIASSVNDTQYELVYRCQNCLAWTDAEGESQSVQTSEGTIGIGYAQGADGPENAGCPEEIELEYHTVGHSTWVADIEEAPIEDYDEMAELATGVVSGECSASTSEPE